MQGKRRPGDRFGTQFRQRFPHPREVGRIGEDAKSMSRLNSGAPSNTHAGPPMSRARTRCARIEERTLRIGFGINKTSEGEVSLPELSAFSTAWCGCEPLPFGPLTANQLLRLNHGG